MKKQIITIILISILLTACGNNNKNTANSTVEPTVASVSIEEESTPVSLETDSSETEESVYVEQNFDVLYSEYDKQLEVLADHYDDCYAKYYDAVWGYEWPYEMAVADLNRNGRLELLISMCNGTGEFSSTMIFEVNEGLDSVRLLKTPEGEKLDEHGDFTTADEIACYKMGDTYYYEIEDYKSDGWSAKYAYYYSYSFNDELKSSTIGGFTIRAVELPPSNGEHPYNVNVAFCVNDNTLLSSDDEFNDYMKKYWDGYEKQPNVKLRWVDMTTKGDCKDQLQKSLAGYNEASSDNDIQLENYKDFISYFYRGAEEVIIVTE